MNTIVKTHKVNPRPPIRKRAIRHYMTPMPHSIGKDQTLAFAHKTMRDHKLRHLPVLEGGKLVGMLSQRDLYFIETLRGIDIETDVVEEAMRQDVYCVTPEAPIEEVVATMAQQRYGCTVVVQAGRVVGIFTTTDALELLADQLLASQPDETS